MRNYTVKLDLIYSGEVTVQASSKEEAEKEVNNLLESNKININSLSYSHSKINEIFFAFDETLFPFFIFCKEKSFKIDNELMLQNFLINEREKMIEKAKNKNKKKMYKNYQVSYLQMSLEDKLNEVYDLGYDIRFNKV